MREELICPICGEKTRVYMGNARKDKLCGNHADQLKINLIEQNAEGFFVDCKTKKVLNKDYVVEPTLNDKSNSTKINCLICGKESDGMHFCKDCYYKFKDRSIDIRIINCIKTEILDGYGNKKLCCDDGRKVRSKSELIISNFLFNNKIRAVYEKEIYYTENGENKTLHPDFYLPDFDLYIEHNGYSGKEYEKQKEYSQKIYGQLNYTIIITSEEDINNINACLKPQLGLH